MFVILFVSEDLDLYSCILEVIHVYFFIFLRYFVVYLLLIIDFLNIFTTVFLSFLCTFHFLFLYFSVFLTFIFGTEEMILIGLIRAVSDFSYDFEVL